MKWLGKILIIVVLLSFNCGQFVEAQSGTVAIAPFEISGSGDISYLGTTLTSDLVRSVEQQGFNSLSLGDVAQEESMAALKERANSLGADYILSGNLSRISERLAIEGQLEGLTNLGQTGAQVMVKAGDSESLSALTDRFVIAATDHLYGGGTAVSKVEVQGNSRVDSQAILNVARLKAGGLSNPQRVANDIKAIYGMGYFEDVKVESFANGGIRFVVIERPPIDKIIFTGNKKISDKRLEKDLGLAQFSMANEAKIAEAVSNIQKAYEEKGFRDIAVNTSLVTNEQGLVILTFNIDEGGRMFIRNIEFEGNDTFSSRKLRGVISSSKKGLIPFVTSKGVLDREKIAEDIEKITSFYSDNGFVQIQVGDPYVETAEEDGFYLTFPISEGKRYKVAEVGIVGDLAEQDIEELMKIVTLKAGEYYSRSKVQNDLGALKSFYADLGYAQNVINPQINDDEENQLVSLQYVIEPNHLVYFDRITIVGNDKTRDKVIRRQLEVTEGDLFSAKGLKDSQNNLMRTGYFERINIVPNPGDTDETVNLRLEVKERPTGAFQIGAGYSNYNSVFGMVKVTQDNLFGYGRRLGLEASLGGKSNYYNLSYTDPWTFDLPLTTGLDIFKYYTRYDDYRKDSIGSSARAGYPLFEKVYGVIQYSWEDVDISRIPDDASIGLKEMKGRNIDSIFSIILSRDTKNHFFVPTRGSSNRINIDMATAFIGGDTRFTRYDVSSAWWYPMPMTREKVSLMAKGRAGYVEQNKKGGLPIYQKYEIGGINTVRGYDWYTISPKDAATGDNLGGEKMAIINLEMVFPIWEESGLYGVGFFDAGQVWGKKESVSIGDLRKSYGAGFRYQSPLGPLRIEYGRALDREPGDSSGRWEFTVGGIF